MLNLTTFRQSRRRTVIKIDAEFDDLPTVASAVVTTVATTVVTTVVTTVAKAPEFRPFDALAYLAALASAPRTVATTGHHRQRPGQPRHRNFDRFEALTHLRALASAPKQASPGTGISTVLRH